MPYVPKHLKALVDEDLLKLNTTLTEYSRGAENDDTALADVTPLLNYIFNILALSAYMNIPREARYRHLERIMGLFESAKLEFWRRVVVPYEEEAKGVNGDIFTDET